MEPNTTKRQKHETLQIKKWTEKDDDIWLYHVIVGMIKSLR